ncbi:MAG: hypothetical protein WA103_01145 [Minisyncoccales bacterium]
MRIASIFAVIVVFAVAIYGFCGEEAATQTAWHLSLIVICFAGLDCAWQLLINAREEITDAIHSRQSTRRVLKNLSGALIIGYYATVLAWNSIQVMSALENGNILAIVALPILGAITVILGKKVKEPLNSG